jgi:chromosome segregation ATPase
MKQTIEELEGTDIDLNYQMQSLKKDLTATKQKLSDVEIGAPDSDKLRTREHRDIIDRLQSEHLAIENQLVDHIEKLNQQIIAARESIPTRETTIAKLQQQLRVAKRTAPEKDERLVELERTKAEAIQDLTQRARSEKESLIQAYELH